MEEGGRRRRGGGGRRKGGRGEGEKEGGEERLHDHVTNMYQLHLHPHSAEAMKALVQLFTCWDYLHIHPLPAKQCGTQIHKAIFPLEVHQLF